jgi:hypothetical protein
VSIDDGPRTRWLWAQAIAWLVVAVLALPARRSAGDDDADGDIDADADIDPNAEAATDPVSADVREGVTS